MKKSLAYDFYKSLCKYLCMSNTNNNEIPPRPGGTKVVNVNSQTGGQTPQANSPSGNQQPPKQSGGGPEGQSQVNTGELQKVVTPPSSSSTTTPSGTVPSNDDIDIEGMINAGEKETAEIDKDKKARQERMEYLTKAIHAIRGPKAFERLIFNNVETGEMVGTKIRYIKDSDGKTAYDYMNDPIIQEHLEFVVPDDDPKDGSPVDRQISYFWKKPTF